MKMTRLVSVTLFMLCLFSNIHASTNEISVLSPSKEVSVHVFNVNGQMMYEIQYQKIEILHPSRLLWEINGKLLGAKTQLRKVRQNKAVTTSYPYMGNHAMAKNRYKSFVLDLCEDNEEYQMEFRVYDTGVAFRYMTQSEDTVSVGDFTEFRLPLEVDCWLQPNPRFYEDDYARYRVGSLPQNVMAGPPVTLRYAEDVYASITEGGLSDFGGMGLKVIAPDCLKSQQEGKTKLSGEIATPWRVVMTGDLNSLVNNDIVTDVSKPLSPLLKNQQWIQPGNCVWSWLAGYGVSLQNMKRFTDWAAELGILYNLVDEGWSYWADKEKGLDAWQMVADLVEYSKTRGVKILLWKAYPDRKGIEGIQTPERRRKFFQKCKELGVAGLKIDFFDKESQEVTRYYEETLKDAAEFGLIINYHGSNKPTGLNRTYPNELSREGIKGLEYGQSNAVQNVITPYTRFVAGHADYTPMAFEKGRMGNTTEAHQIATTAIFLSPLRCYGGRPEDYLTHPARSVFMAIPTVWDETIVLPPSEIGECVVMAHRKGTEWFVAAITDQPKSITLPLIFLGKGKYKADIVADRSATEKECEVSHGNYTRQDQLAVNMVAGGGYLIRLY